MHRMRSAFGVLALLAAAACASAPKDGAPQARAAGAPAFKQSDLLGRPALELDALLGAPALVRREGKGEFRRYAFEMCALIVILYPDDSGAVAARSLAAAAKASGEAKPDLDRCLADGPARAG